MGPAPGSTSHWIQAQEFFSVVIGLVCSGQMVDNLMSCVCSGPQLGSALVSGCPWMAPRSRDVYLRYMAPNGVGIL